MALDVDIEGNFCYFNFNNLKAIIFSLINQGAIIYTLGGTYTTQD
jgi:hypothetical protein